MLSSITSCLRSCLIPASILFTISLVSPADAQSSQPADSASPSGAATDDIGRDNQGSDDGDANANDDPVWGYFLGKSAYIFFHQLAGAVHAAHGLAPVADTSTQQEQLTTLLLITEGKKRFGGAVLLDAVIGWAQSWRQSQQDEGGATGPDADKPDGWDAKNISADHLSNLLCGIYGSDPGHFHSLIESGDIKRDETDGCINAYRKLADQWVQTLSHAGLSLASGDGKNGAADVNQTDDIGIAFQQHPSKAAELTDFTGWLKDVGLFESLTTEVNRDLKGEAPLQITLRQCDGEAATLVTDKGKSGEMSLCYEWLKSVYDAANAQSVDAPPE